MNSTNDPKTLESPHRRWANFRFSVVGPLLAAPPARGHLQGQLQALAAKRWRHPISGQWVSFGVSTIERWYYTARAQTQDPVGALARKIRGDHGRHRALKAAVGQLLAAQYAQHPSWSYRLHLDNLAVLLDAEPELGPAPSYSSVLRWMKAHGYLKRPRRGPAHSPGARKAEARMESREIRSYQSTHVHALWHLDFHHGSLRVLQPKGQWAYPLLLAVLDDRSRLCCHAQWYLAEGAEELCHGLCQAFQKRALPRALMHDNGSAMVAKETRQGLLRLGVLQEYTLPFSPYQNGKQEVFWSQVEARLLAMLEGQEDLSLGLLNQATQAWIEMEYNRKRHRELAQSPIEAYRQAPDSGRPCPTSEALQQAFTVQARRSQRRSDGTISLEGVRYEIPSRYGHWEDVLIRYAHWDRGHVHLCDPHNDQILCRIYPVDKQKNAQGQRARRSRPAEVIPQPPAGMAPLLQKFLADYAACGLPPAYLPKDETDTPSTEPSAS